MKKVFFIGICGISMSGLSVLLKHKGYEVFGCDRNYKNPPTCLKNESIKVFSEKKIGRIKDCDLVVYSSAIGDNHPALKKARELKKVCVSRGELLGQVSKSYEKTIAIAGSHGKTTTTAMIYNCLYVAGKNPTLHLGGILKKENTNVIVGGDEYFITEACEYHDNFLYLKPYISVVTNVEKEHLDYFKTFEKEKLSFQKFKDSGLFVVDRSGLTAKNVRINKSKGISFDVMKADEKLGRINLKIGGYFNAQNALFAIEVCFKLGLSFAQIKLGLESFLGTKKRLENVNIFGKEIVVDYAHHPTEIKESLKFLKKASKDYILIFQPHTFSRTKTLLKEFISVFSKVKNLYLFKTYSAREKSSQGMSAKELCCKLKKAGKNAKYISALSQAKKLLKSESSKGLIVLMGAGDLPEKLGIN